MTIPIGRWKSSTNASSHMETLTEMFPRKGNRIKKHTSMIKGFGHLDIIPYLKKVAQILGGGWANDANP